MVNERRLRSFVKESRPRFEDLLGQMVEVPSISMDSSRAGDMRRMADLARQYLAGMNAKVQVVETGGYPIVSGGWIAGPSIRPSQSTIIWTCSRRRSRNGSRRRLPLRMKTGCIGGEERPMIKARHSRRCLALNMLSSKVGRSTSDSCGNWKKRSGARILPLGLKTAVRFHDRIPWLCRIRSGLPRGGLRCHTACAACSAHV